MASSYVEAPVLVGRTAELERCDRLIAAAVDGQGALLLVSGEAGIGKTALTRAIGERASMQGVGFAVGRCFETDAMPAFAPWQEGLQELSRTGQPGLGELPTPFATAGTSRTAFELQQQVTRALIDSASQRPVVLCLDDVHWADPDTLDLLWFLGRELHVARLLAIATFRSEDINAVHPLAAMLPRLRHDAPTEMLQLRQLALDDTTRLVESRAGPCAPELADQLHARSEGNPFYVVELLRDLQEQQVLNRDVAGRWSPPEQDLPVPNMLQHVIVQRLARLTEDAQWLLKVASVVGQEWQLSTVEAVLAWDEGRVLAALSVALASHAIELVAETPESYRFAHALFREVVHGQILLRRRKQLHRDVAGALESQSPIDANPAIHGALAYHFAAAEDWPKTAHYAISAGEWSRARYATRSALRFYELARQGLQCQSGSTQGAETAAAIRVHERIARLHMLLNEQELAAAAIERMNELAHASGDRVAEGEALVWRSAINARINRIPEAREAANAVLELAAGTGDSRLQALAHRSVGHLHLVTVDDVTQATEHLQRGVQFAREGNHVDALTTCLYELSVLNTWMGDYAVAERIAEEQLAMAKNSRDVTAWATACFALGMARVERGRYQAALDVLQLGIDTATEAGEVRYVIKLMNTRAGLHVSVGDFEMARHWSERALAASRAARDAGVLEAERYALVELASADFHLGRTDAAGRVLDELESLLDVTPYARNRYLNRYQLLRGEIALARLDAPQAQHWAVQARTLAEAKNLRKNIARSWLLGGRARLAAGQVDTAVADLRHGVAVADGAQNAALTWQGRVWLAQALMQRRPTEARDTYLEACARIDTIAAGLSDRRIRDALLGAPLVRQARAGAAAMPTNGKTLYPAGLSAREVEILKLVAGGATNARVAQELSISPRTVDVHMTSILNKTGCANRAAAVSFAARHGIT